MSQDPVPQILDRSPLIYVLAQVMFASPVLAMPKYLADIHDALRQMGFDDVQEGIEKVFELSPTGVEAVSDRRRWDFLRKDRRCGVVLTERTVVLHTAEYTTFHAFREMLLAVAHTVIAAARVNQLQRLGLRYVDRVRLGDDDRAEAYVVSSMLGFPREWEAMLGGERMMSRSDTLLRTSVGALAIRCTEATGTALPPDLVPTLLEIEALPQEERVLLLDFDHFTVEPMGTERDGIGAAFDQLHGPVGDAFRMVTTEYAMNSWGRRDLVE